MTQQEAAIKLKKELKLVDGIETKIDKIDAFLQQADKVITESHFLIVDVDNFLQSPSDTKLYHPIAAWRGAIPNMYEADRAKETLMQFAKENEPFLQDIMDLRDTYTKCMQDIAAFFEKQNNFYERITPKNPNAPTIALDAASLKIMQSQLGKLPLYNKQLDKILATIATYEPRMKSIKSKINTVKGVN
ncbi:MAG: hypothetical protein ACYDCN_04005 [Bacteroidia bacterium]